MNTRRVWRNRALTALPSLLFLMLAAHAQDPVGAADLTPAQLGAEVLLERAEVQMQLDELDAAEESFLEAIDRIAEDEGDFAASLIRAYAGLARVFSARGDFLEAVSVLEEARHVSQRNFGLFNLEQFELLDELSSIYEQAGDTRQAQREQVEILTTAQRHFGADTVDVVPYHFRLAGYYERARMRGLAREQLEHALEIVREDPETIPADELEVLTELVRIDTAAGDTTRARRDLEAMLQTATDAAPVARAEALAVLGDRELAIGRLDEARDYYARAAEALPGSDVADAYFASPRSINFVPPPSPVDWGRRRNNDFAWGSITARFSLNGTGKAQRIAITHADPPGLMDAVYARRLAEAVFRPRIVAGEPVATERLRFTHEFRYFLPDDG